ncbi:MAG: Gx transporter family protein [Clostridia bacterium]|nr:Gx transporter family protein [Clostridia bacterium]
MKNKRKSVAERTAIDGILAAVALVLSFLENMLPDVAFLPPGAKLGLANVAVMLAVLAVGIGDGFILVLIKSGFVFLTRGASSFFMSISGGLFSFAVLALIVIIAKKSDKAFSYIFVSVCCALMHNIGQTVAVSIYMGTNLINAYLPVLLVFGILSGIITGVILKTVMPAVLKINFFKDWG